MRRGRKKADPCGQRGGSSALKSGFVGTATASGRNGLQKCVNQLGALVCCCDGRVQNATDAKVGWSMDVGGDKDGDGDVPRLRLQDEMAARRWPVRVVSLHCTALLHCKARAWLFLPRSFFFFFVFLAGFVLLHAAGSQGGRGRQDWLMGPTLSVLEKTRGGGRGPSISEVSLFL